MTRNSSYVAEQIVGKLMIDLLIPSDDFAIAAEGDKAREILRDHEEEIAATIRAIKKLTFERCAQVAAAYSDVPNDIPRQIESEILLLRKEDSEKG